jgi:hypothetical protein
MPAGVPAWAGDYASKGHAGTYMQKDVGTYGTLAGHWLKWVFWGDKESAEFFKSDKAAAAGWTNLEKKNLDKIPTIEGSRDPWVLKDYIVLSIVSRV